MRPKHTNTAVERERLSPRPRCDNRMTMGASTRLRRTATALSFAWMAALAGCPLTPPEPQPINPFADLTPVPLDGQPRAVASTITPLGEHDEGDVIRVFAEGDRIESLLLLAADDEIEQAGRIAGGGLANTSLLFRIPERGRYFVFLQFESPNDEEPDRATLSVSVETTETVPPRRQSVVIRFEDGYLSQPGLFDPDSGTEDERTFLESISGQVRDEIITRLERIFDGTGVDIVDDRSEIPAPPFSTVTFSPQRVVTTDAPLAVDAALPIDSADGECQDLVIFGEVLPRGTPPDPGNRILDDDAVVYVGSFQGRGESCRTAAVNSVNNIVLGLAQTAAHEIGHLVGLNHIALIGIMDRSPSRAFQRELTFQRSQILTQSKVDGPDGEPQVLTTVLTTIVQDPEFYFNAVLGG